MDEVIITLGTTSEIVQKAIEYANTNIVINWIVFWLALGMAIMSIIGLIVGITAREPFTIAVMLFATITFILMMGFTPYNVFLWEQKIEVFSQNPDEAIEYYIDNIMEVSHD